MRKGARVGISELSDKIAKDKVVYAAVGRRKTSSAQVRISVKDSHNGKMLIKVNNKSLQDYFSSGGAGLLRCIE